MVLNVRAIITNVIKQIIKAERSDSPLGLTETLVALQNLLLVHRLFAVVPYDFIGVLVGQIGSYMGECLYH